MRNWLALVGVLLIVAGACLSITVAQVRILSLASLLLGVILTIPWWFERLRRENAWWEKRDEPLDTPPRVPN